MMSDITAFDARAVIRIGSREFHLSGRGSISDPQGIVRGTYRHDLPANDFEPYVLQVVLVTGYPSICRSAIADNPFKSGDYNYRREVDFGKHGTLNYRAACWTEDTGSGRRLCSEFDVQADLSLPAIGPASCVRERWIPAGTGISSGFDICWPRLDGSGDVSASARSTYVPHPAAPSLHRPTERAIRFSDVIASAGSLSLVQESWLEN
jgi:hypothetical protein